MKMRFNFLTEYFILKIYITLRCWCRELTIHAAFKKCHYIRNYFHIRVILNFDFHVERFTYIIITKNKRNELLYRVRARGLKCFTMRKVEYCRLCCERTYYSVAKLRAITIMYTRLIARTRMSALRLFHAAHATVTHSPLACARAGFSLRPWVIPT